MTLNDLINPASFIFEKNECEGFIYETGPLQKRAWVISGLLELSGGYS
jgi:hypothetical protein